MIDQLCQGYHWSLKEAMSLTLPQVILLGHAAWANDKRSKARSAAKEQEEPNPTIMVGGKQKPFSEMSTDDAQEYYNW